MAQFPSDRPDTNLPEKGYPPGSSEREVIIDEDEDLDLWPRQRGVDRFGRRGIGRERDPSRDRDSYRAESMRIVLIDRHR